MAGKASSPAGRTSSASRRCDLDEGVAQSTTRRVSLALGARGAEPALAMSLNNLSVRYGEVGRRADGLAAIEEAVAIQRRPAAASPDAYEPDLAMSLWASACVRVGLQTDLRTAFDCAKESASVYRMWAERVPGMRYSGSGNRKTVRARRPGCRRSPRSGFALRPAG